MLQAESQDLDATVRALPPSQWAAPTPAIDWTIAHQIAHLNWTDRASLLALTDPGGFAELQRAAADDLTAVVEAGAAEGATREPAELLARWRRDRDALPAALRATGGSRVRWIGTTMAPASMATARIMETWAHGQDIADALALDRPATARLRRVAHLGIATRDFAYHANGIAAPGEPFRIELIAPDGSVWAWGPPERTTDVTGPALDFCLLVTRRRHRADLDLRSTAIAEPWLTIARAYAGPPGAGRPPRSTTGPAKS